MARKLPARLFYSARIWSQGYFFYCHRLIWKTTLHDMGRYQRNGSIGMSIQSHTVTHQPLAHMGEERVLFELSESKRVIEERLGQEVRHLSLPHGSKNGKTWPIAKEIGYLSICTSDVGFQTWESNGPWIKRINIGDKISEKTISINSGKVRIRLPLK